MLNTAIVPKPAFQLLVALVAAELFLQLPTAHAQYNFPIGYTQCYSCQAGTFIGAEGSGECLACGPGFYQDSNGSSACNECPEGAMPARAPGAQLASRCLLRRHVQRANGGV